MFRITPLILLSLNLLVLPTHATPAFTPEKRQDTFTSFEDICEANADDCGNGFCCVEGTTCDKTSSENPLCFNEANTYISVPAIDFSSYISEFSSLDAMASSAGVVAESQASVAWESFFSIISNGELFSSRPTAVSTVSESMSESVKSGAAGTPSPSITTGPRVPVTRTSVAPAATTSTGGAAARVMGINAGGLVAAGMLLL